MAECWQWVFVNDANSPDLNISKVEIDNNASRNTKMEGDEHVLVLESNKNKKDCIENFQNDVRKILNESTEDGKTKKVKILIKDDGGNCTKEPAQK